MTILDGAHRISLAALVLATPAWATVKMEDGSGRVEVVTEGASKGTGILPGEELKGTLRTGKSSRATLVTDDGAKLELADSSRATPQSGQGEFRLDTGHLTVQTGSRPLRVTAGPGAIVVEGAAAQFEVGVTSAGVEVISRKGPLSVHSGDKVVAIADGTRMTFGNSPGDSAAPPEPAAPAKAPPAAALEAAPGSAAPAPTPAPKPMVLKVSWPSGPVSSGTVTIKGTTTPGAAVKVNGADATVKSNGRFTASIELPEGESVVEVKASANGEDKVDSQKVTVAAKAAAPESEPTAKAAPEAEAPAADAKPDSNADDQAKPKKKSAKPKVKEEASGWE